MSAQQPFVQGSLPPSTVQDMVLHVPTGDRMRKEVRFVIDALKPETLSLGRLAAYLHELNRLFGNPDGVHFDKVEPGSAVLLAWSDEQAHRVISQRSGAHGNPMPSEALGAMAKLNALLRDDRASGTLHIAGADVIPFPGCKQPAPQSIGPVHQSTTVQGQLIRIGGRDKSVPFELQDGRRIIRGNTTREMARYISPHLFGPTLRAVGSGAWTRSPEGDWTLYDFRATQFEVLDDTTLSEAIAQLRDAANGTSRREWTDLRDDDEAE